LIKRFLKAIFRIAVYLLLAGAAVAGIARLITAIHSWRRIYTVEEAPVRRVAIVFGAGLWRDGSPTPVLRDRVETAAELYFAGKVQKLLMSGDNRFVEYNEPAAMRQYALELGVPEEAIVLDFAGRSTYETCYRAKVIFQAYDSILVTQGFHLPRALYTCSALGLDTAGVTADRRVYPRRPFLYWNLREIPATINALWEVHVSHPLPVLGNVEPIFPDDFQ